MKSPPIIVDSSSKFLPHILKWLLSAYTLWTGMRFRELIPLSSHNALFKSLIPFFSQKSTQSEINIGIPPFL